jgi:hypothetical protein
MATAILRICEVSAPGGDVYGKSDIFVTIRQGGDGPAYRTPVQMDRDTVTVAGEFIFRDLVQPLDVVVWDADQISANDVVARYEVPLTAGAVRQEYGDEGYVEYEVDIVQVVDLRRLAYLEALEEETVRFAATITARQ